MGRRTFDSVLRWDSPRRGRGYERNDDKVEVYQAHDTLLWS